MELHVYKYQGAGNDFVIIDNRKGNIELTTEQVRWLCDRRFGIGSDGLMLLDKADGYDFSMRYFNSDGPEGTMCGNGGRCLVAFADHCGIKNFKFIAIDGVHEANILKREGFRKIVKLKMIDIKGFEPYSESAYFLNTGSPHYVEFVGRVADYPVAERGYFWRHHKDFKGGTNVNFVEFGGYGTGETVLSGMTVPLYNNEISVRTFERGVEAETYACGTGITASALCTFMRFNRPQMLKQGKSVAVLHCNVKALGDRLSVDVVWNEQEKIFTDVWLTGPATLVFETNVELPL